MKEQFVTYEIALRLKELGFDEECIAFYFTHLKDYPVELIIGRNSRSNECFKKAGAIDCCLAPLWQQVIDWLREKHDIIISIKYWGKRNITSQNSTLFPKLYSCSICRELIPKEKWIEAWSDTYEEAREQAILKSIELCQEKKK